jgi:hypothetical protein
MVTGLYSHISVQISYLDLDAFSKELHTLNAVTHGNTPLSPIFFLIVVILVYDENLLESKPAYLHIASCSKATRLLPPTT